MANLTTPRSTIVLRTILGGVFVVAPLATVLRLFPEPVLPPDAAAFVAALTRSGFLMPLLHATELAAGVLLILGIATPFALILLAPIVVNIFAFHLFLAPAGLGIALVIGALEIALAWRYGPAFASLVAGVRHPHPSEPLPSGALERSAYTPARVQWD